MGHARDCFRENRTSVETQDLVPRVDRTRAAIGPGNKPVAAIVYAHPRHEIARSNSLRERGEVHLDPGQHTAAMLARRKISKICNREFFSSCVPVARNHAIHRCFVPKPVNAREQTAGPGVKTDRDGETRLGAKRKKQPQMEIKIIEAIVSRFTRTDVERVSKDAVQGPILYNFRFRRVQSRCHKPKLNDSHLTTDGQV